MDTLFSPSWYRVAELKPRIRRHIEIHRHVYRDSVWFILQDPVAGRSHRFSPAAYRFIGMMDGVQTVDSIWNTLNEQAGDEAPTQDEVIRLLGQLHSADALITDANPDSLELFRRHQRQDRMKLKQKLWTPLVVRIPVLDPEKFLERTLPYISWLFGRWGGLLWLAVVTSGATLAAVNWGPLTENIVDRTLAPENLLLLWFVYPCVKALHELGHGYAIKKGGGEVHEIGIMFLVLIPVPYVDASAAWGFSDKRQRMLVGAAGIAVELFLGSLALFTWLAIQPGVVHTIAYNVMLISGVSTLLFNGNPLLRFDGYYVLQDALEIPNLGTRANKYLGYLAQRYLFGVSDAESPADSPGERTWFTIYGIAAFVYRIFIMIAIILYISTKFFAVGVLLALWAVTTMTIVPMTKGLKFLTSSQRLRRRRGRSVAVSALIAAGVFAILFVLPIPHWTRAQGVIWPVEEGQVRAGADGFIDKLEIAPGSEVIAGQTLLQANDPLLDVRVRLLEANRKELESRLAAAQTESQVQSEVIREAIRAVDASLYLAREQIADLVVRSPRSGTLVVPAASDLPGRFARQGQVLGYVHDPTDPVTVRVVVPQSKIGLIRGETRRVSVMPTQWRSKPLEAKVLREVPGGTEKLPSAALGIGGGGSIVVDPTDPGGRRTLGRVFEMDIRVIDSEHRGLLGSRVYVRFDHGYEPAGLQLYRAGRQLFLRTFGV